MTRELVVLGTASQAPTKHRNHNGYLLRFDEHGVLFDPGEGTQRQCAFAGVSAGEITRICLTHFHGDHALGLPGILQRLSLDAVPHEVGCYFPAADIEYFHRLRYATPYWERARLAEHPIPDTGASFDLGAVTLTARALDHRIACVGYRVVEPDGRRMIPARLAAAGIAGSDIGRLRRDGRLATPAGIVTLERMSVPRPGQVVAFVMDTGVCAGAAALAADADLLVIESTFLESEAELASSYAHLTARQAGRLAADAGVRELVLTHFSQRYRYEQAHRFADEAAQEFDGPIHLATDLARIPLPARRATTEVEV
jgi:ribonuclease Z